MIWGRGVCASALSTAVRVGFREQVDLDVPLQHRDLRPESAAAAGAAGRRRCGCRERPDGPGVDPSHCSLSPASRTSCPEQRQRAHQEVVRFDDKSPADSSFQPKLVGGRTRRLPAQVRRHGHIRCAVGNVALVGADGLGLARRRRSPSRIGNSSPGVEQMVNC